MLHSFFDARSGATARLPKTKTARLFSFCCHCVSGLLGVQAPPMLLRALMALTMLKAPEARAALEYNLTHPNPEVRKHAKKALSRQPAEEATPEQADGFGNPLSEVRVPAIEDPKRRHRANSTCHEECVPGSTLTLRTVRQPECSGSRAAPR